MKTTETDFIKWIKDTKGISIDRKGLTRRTSLIATKEEAPL